MSRRETFRLLWITSGVMPKASRIQPYIWYQDQQIYRRIHPDNGVDAIVGGIGGTPAHIAPGRFPFGIQLFLGPGFRGQDVLFPPGGGHFPDNGIIQVIQSGGSILPGTDKDQFEILPSQLGRHIPADGSFAFLQAHPFFIDQVRFVPDEDAGFSLPGELPEQFRIPLMQFVRKHTQEHIIVEKMELIDELVPGKGFCSVSRQIHKGGIPVFHQKGVPGWYPFPPPPVPPDTRRWH